EIDTEKSATNFIEIESNMVEITKISEIIESNMVKFTQSLEAINDGSEQSANNALEWDLSYRDLSS
ncbi:hypothetical protein, partial [Yersinia sp. 2542 StPb PI]|uniref:hypothetical protein n=1 Tax=Yersinia sp. 2542 StPb PI TaxID=3117408 RepID=UPI003B2888A1